MSHYDDDRVRQEATMVFTMATVVAGITLGQGATVEAVTARADKLAGYIQSRAVAAEAHAKAARFDREAAQAEREGRMSRDHP